MFFDIGKWFELDEKQIYKRYTIVMVSVIVFQITIMILIKDLRGIPMGISLGFNVGLWCSYSLNRLLK